MCIRDSLAGAEREDVARADDVRGLRVLCDRHLDGARAVRGGDAGGDALAGLDAHREGRAVGRGVLEVGHHHAQVELLKLLLGEAGIKLILLPQNSKWTQTQ